jgi:hypothetical protein
MHAGCYVRARISGSLMIPGGTPAASRYGEEREVVVTELHVAASGSASATVVVLTADTGTGRPVRVDVAVRTETVEVWHQDRCRAVFDRGILRVWLAHPVRALFVDDVLWAAVDGGDIALAITGAASQDGPFVLPARVYDELRWRI